MKFIKLLSDVVYEWTMTLLLYLLLSITIALFLWVMIKVSEWFILIIPLLILLETIYLYIKMDKE